MHEIGWLHKLECVVTTNCPVQRCGSIAEWQRDAILPPSAELWSEELTLTWNQLMALCYYRGFVTAYKEIASSSQRVVCNTLNTSYSLKYLCGVFVGNPVWNHTMCSQGIFFPILTESHTICIIYHVIFFSSHFLKDTLISLSKQCGRIMQFADKPCCLLWGEVNQTALWSRLIVSQLSLFGEVENCFHNECGSQGQERHLDMRTCWGKPADKAKSPWTILEISCQPHKNCCDQTVVESEDTVYAGTALFRFQ